MFRIVVLLLYLVISFLFHTPRSRSRHKHNCPEIHRFVRRLQCNRCCRFGSFVEKNISRESRRGSTQGMLQQGVVVVLAKPFIPEHCAASTNNRLIPTHTHQRTHTKFNTQSKIVLLLFFHPPDAKRSLYLHYSPAIDNRCHSLTQSSTDSRSHRSNGFTF